MSRSPLHKLCHCHHHSVKYGTVARRRSPRVAPPRAAARVRARARRAGLRRALPPLLGLLPLLLRGASACVTMRRTYVTAAAGTRLFHLCYCSVRHHASPFCQRRPFLVIPIPIPIPHSPFHSPFPFPIPHSLSPFSFPIPIPIPYPHSPFLFLWPHDGGQAFATPTRFGCVIIHEHAQHAHAPHPRLDVL